MNLRPALRLALPAVALLLATTGLFAATAASASASATPPTTLHFAGVPYLHRWSGNGQNEYTPLPQSDLAKWRDMVTIQVYDHVTTADQLARVANTVLLAYQKAGLIIRTNSLPASPGHPAQHMIVAVLSGTGLREMVFARFVLAPEAGEVIVYSHRVYGEQPDAAASEWFKANDIPLERAMMAWSELPSVGALRTLPQAP
jgi:hypothetical protein